MSKEIIGDFFQRSLRSKKQPGPRNKINNVINMNVECTVGISHSLASGKTSQARIRKPTKRLIEEEADTVALQPRNGRNVVS